MIQTRPINTKLQRTRLSTLPHHGQIHDRSVFVLQLRELASPVSSHVHQDSHQTCQCQDLQTRSVYAVPPTCTRLDKLVDKEDKPKRAPSAYNLFVQANMKEWKENNPGAPIKEAMSEVYAHHPPSYLSHVHARSLSCGEMLQRTPIAARSQSLENPKPARTSRQPRQPRSHHPSRTTRKRPARRVIGTVVLSDDHHLLTFFVQNHYFYSLLYSLDHVSAMYS